MGYPKPIEKAMFDPDYWDRIVLLFELLVEGTDYENVSIEEINRPRYEHLRSRLNGAFEKLVDIES